MVGKKSVMYDPLLLYCNSGMSENPTYVSNAFHAVGLLLLDVDKFIDPPLVGTVPDT
jgi:hypothetical protein